ncbi:hypothetical protein BU17DRAFT_64076 [Hysterangium stoloniferum]|nr:hypothetical protein BU17DRAFT_64076 [Hysterangium stoloniferum]
MNRLALSLAVGKTAVSFLTLFWKCDWTMYSSDAKTNAAHHQTITISSKRIRPRKHICKCLGIDKECGCNTWSCLLIGDVLFFILHGGKTTIDLLSNKGKVCLHLLKKCGHSMTKNKPKPARLSVAELKTVKDVSMKEHGFAKTTNNKYNQRLCEVRMWLKELVETEQSPTIPPGANELGCHLGSFDWMPGELEGTFNNIPTRASPWILGLFIAYKCFTQKTKVTTAWQIHAAFKQKGTGRGNPANSRDFECIIDAIKRRDANEGSCSHSTAMTKQDMDKIIQWSNQLCPDSMLEELGKLSQGEYWKQLPFVVKHFMIHAFATSRFTLWTRNFKLTKLQYKHITLDLKTNDDYKYTYFKPENPNIDMHFHFLRWLQFSNQFIYHRPLEADDYIFPAIGSNGIARIKTPIPHDTIQKWLDEFVEACGVQYHFMYAHFGKGWSLAIIRWWGGWAEGEHRDTLIRYLLDELYHYEESHGDALQLISHEADKSFLSEYIESQPPSKSELCEMMVAQAKALKEKILTSLTAAPIAFAASGDTNTGHTAAGDNPGPHSRTSQMTPNEINVNANTKNPAMLTLPENCRLCIPSIVRKGPLHLCWKQIIHDWESADPSRGHYVPLKDWDPEWLRGENRTTFGVKCQQDDTVFLTKWPATHEGPKKLLEAITDDLKDREVIKL